MRLWGIRAFACQAPVSGGRAKRRLVEDAGIGNSLAETLWHRVRENPNPQTALDGQWNQCPRDLIWGHDLCPTTQHVPHLVLQKR